jgi:uncharacterized protein YcsI (UPF0317 family)
VVEASLAALSPAELRSAIRSGDYGGRTPGLALGYVQANLVVVEQDDAFDFLRFCVRNPAAAPVLEVGEPGDPRIAQLARDSDIRFDLPRYRVFEEGVVVAETEDIEAYWRDDLVYFLLGCSLTFEAALLDGGVPLRHLESGSAVPAYITNVECTPAGRFQGPLVVSMRPVPGDLVARAVSITERLPAGHGAPVHIGAPEALGISDLAAVDYGEPPNVEPGDIPVFWACGVTPQAIAEHVKLSFMISHAPGHMYVTDVRSDSHSLQAPDASCGY